MADFWSMKPVGGANYMMLRYALYPINHETISRERYNEMRAYCSETFGDNSLFGANCWISSPYSKSFAFKNEGDRIVFRMAFPEG
jgi:hypothetical protein